MADLRDRFRDLDTLDVPDLMTEAERRGPRPPMHFGPSPAKRAAIAAIALLIAAVPFAAFSALDRSDNLAGPQPSLAPVVCRWLETPYDLPDMAGTAYHVAGTSQDDLWVLEEKLKDKGPVLQHFDGATWTTAPLPQGPIQDMHAISPNDLWALGTDGVSRFDGTSWTSQPLSTEGGLVAGLENGELDVRAADDAWVVGQMSNGKTYVSIAQHWDGVAWTVLYRSDKDDLGLDAAPTFNAISAWGPGDVWAVGYVPVGPEHGIDLAPMATHWDGSAWTAIPMKDRQPSSQYQHNAEAVLATGPMQAFVATTHGMYTYDGDRWTVDDYTPDPLRYGWTLDQGATGIWALSVSMRGNELVRWDGTSWENDHVAPKHGDWAYDMVALGDSAVVVGGGYQNGDSPAFAIRVDC